MVKHVTFLLLVRSRPQCSCYLSRLRDIAAQASSTQLEVRVQIAVTGKDTELTKGDANGDLGARCVCGPDTPNGQCCCGAPGATEKLEYVNEKTGDMESAPGQEIACCSANPDAQREGKVSGESDLSISKGGDEEDAPKANVKPVTRTPSDISDPPAYKTEIEWSFGSRPDLEEFIRYPVEAATGETCVAVCGGKSLSGRVRNIVAKMSDDRAVHKGSGAQGIMLHVEEFGF